MTLFSSFCIHNKGLLSMEPSPGIPHFGTCEHMNLLICDYTDSDVGPLRLLLCTQTVINASMTHQAEVFRINCYVVFLTRDTGDWIFCIMSKCSSMEPWPLPISSYCGRWWHHTNCPSFPSLDLIQVVCQLMYHMWGLSQRLYWISIFIPVGVFCSQHKGAPVGGPLSMQSS